MPATICLFLVLVLLALNASSGPAFGRDVPVMLKPQTLQQKQACDLLVQGSQLLRARQPFKARPLMEQAAALWPDSPHIHFNLGACYSEMGDFPRAINEYQTALHLDRHMTECIPNIATCYQLMGQYDEAIQFFQNYLREDPNAPDAAEMRGMIAALQRQASSQIASDANSDDYLASICRNGRPERWLQNRLPLKIFISNGTDEQGRYVNGFREQDNEYLLEALNTWVKASNYRLAYTLVDDASKADIVCTWTDRKDFLKEQSTSVEQGAARVLSGPSRQEPGVEEIQSVRVIILVNNPATGQVISDEDMKKTCLHELGHALGFAGHSTNNRDVMFYSESPTVWAALTKRDKNTMSRLYQSYPPFSWQPGAQALMTPVQPQPYQVQAATPPPQPPQYAQPYASPQQYGTQYQPCQQGYPQYGR